MVLSVSATQMMLGVYWYVDYHDAEGLLVFLGHNNSRTGLHSKCSHELNVTRRRQDVRQAPENNLLSVAAEPVGCLHLLMLAVVQSV
jgi:hypothetical protein